jgi:Zn-dependent metalloprotease
MQIAKSVATVAAVLMVLVPLQQASAAKVRDLRFSDGRQFIGLRKQALNQLGPGATRTELHSRILSLDRGIAISSKGSEVWRGTKTYRYEQTFNGIPIYQYPIAVVERESGEVLDVSGAVVDDLGQDITTLIPKITPEAALKLAQDDWSMPGKGTEGIKSP